MQLDEGRPIGETLRRLLLILARLSFVFGPSGTVAWWLLQSNGWSATPFVVGAIWILGTFCWASIVYRVLFRHVENDIITKSEWRRRR